MVNQEQKNQMLEFLISKLNHEAIPKSIDLHGNKTDYIFTEEGPILLVNKKFGEDNFNKVLNATKNEFPNFGIVFYKDGETFFRSAIAGEDKTGIQSKQFKMYGKSLKHYTTEDLRRMISLSPEEILVNSERKLIQYYQPKSKRLNEKLVTCTYAPVIFDYSHKQYPFENKSSKRLYLLNNSQETSKPLKLDNKVLNEINSST